MRLRRRPGDHALCGLGPTSPLLVRSMRRSSLAGHAPNPDTDDPAAPDRASRCDDAGAETSRAGDGGHVPERPSHARATASHPDAALPCAAPVDAEAGGDVAVVRPSPRAGHDGCSGESALKDWLL